MRLRRHVLLLTTLSTTGIAVSAEPTNHEVDVNDVTMSYVEEGTGEAVVFVHGAVSDARIWEPIRPEISDQHHFIAPTLRYFGPGEWSDEGENFSTATHASDVAAFIEALDLGPVHLVGWSYGGGVATTTALKNPDLVQSLILFEPPMGNFLPEGDASAAASEAAGQMFGPVGAALEEGDAEKATRLLVEGVFQMEPGGFESELQAPTESQSQALREVQLANARTTPLLMSEPGPEVTCDMLGQFDKPVLVVRGGDSNAFWVQIAEGMVACLPQVEMSVLPGVNHNGPVRDPVGLAKLIEDFVASH